MMTCAHPSNEDPTVHVAYTLVDVMVYAALSTSSHLCGAGLVEQGGHVRLHMIRHALPAGHGERGAHQIRYLQESSESAHQEGQLG
jgi:hypothetical protein